MRKKIIYVFVLILFLFSILANVQSLQINTNNIIKSSTEEKRALLIDLHNQNTTDDIIDLFAQNGWDREKIKKTIGPDLIESLEWIINKSDDSDSVLIYINAHGNTLVFSDHGYSMKWEDLASYIDCISASKIAIWISTCHSGAAIPLLEKNNRIIATVCKSEENSHSNSLFIHTLHGYPDLEGNNDGYVSFYEAFDYFKKDFTFPGCIQTPQISDRLDEDFYLIDVNKKFINISHIDVYNAHPLHNMKDVGHHLRFAQSFIPTSKKITKIRFLMKFKASNYQGNLIFKIKKELFGDDLATTMVDIESVKNDYFFDINLHDISFEPDEIYYMIFTSEPGKNFGVLAFTDGNYENGKSYFLNNNRWIECETEDFLFITYTDEINNPPNRPSKPKGPDSGTNNVKYTYEITANDPEEDNIYYKVDWGDGEDSNWLGPYDSGGAIKLSHTWIQPGFFKIRVKVKDIHELKSDWSESLNIDIPKNKEFKSHIINFIEKIYFFDFFLSKL